MSWILQASLIIFGMLYPVCAMAGTKSIIEMKQDKDSGTLRVRAFVRPKIELRMDNTKLEISGSGATRGSYLLQVKTEPNSHSRQITFSPF